ncbi:hypothetical protein COY17_02155 [Candidatus Saccharibacteria bacterium CG_4_10_14_0_2_um_filter_52_9]|nr:MAG: hypothetical protein COY17_02155 [Candidatus Saccharibacteria bacterium CG_4_10_14_0_2_um_filter_52_9]
MTNTSPNQEPQSEGARRLELISRSDLIGKELRLADGRVVSAEDFSCGDNATEVFDGIDATPEGPDRDEAIEVAKIIFENHFGSLIEQPE